MALWRPARPSRINTKKDVLSVIGDLNAKIGRDTCSNRQVRPWSTKWRRAKANRVLPRECTGHNKHPLPKAQETTLHMDITRWSILKSDWLYSLLLEMEKIYTASKNKTGSWLWLRSWTPYCKFRLKLKKVGKNTRPFRYDLNQIPNNYMVEMTNRLKGSEELCAWSTWRTMEKGSWHCKEGGDTQEKEMQKVKKDVWGGLTNIWEKKKS